MTRNGQCRTSRAAKLKRDCDWPHEGRHASALDLSLRHTVGLLPAISLEALEFTSSLKQAYGHKFLSADT